MSRLLAILGSAFLIVVVLTHVAERWHFFPVSRRSTRRIHGSHKSSISFVKPWCHSDGCWCRSLVMNPIVRYFSLKTICFKNVLLLSWITSKPSILTQPSGSPVSIHRLSRLHFCDGK